LFSVVDEVWDMQTDTCIWGGLLYDFFGLFL